MYFGRRNTKRAVCHDANSDDETFINDLAEVIFCNKMRPELFKHGKPSVIGKVLALLKGIPFNRANTA